MSGDVYEDGVPQINHVGTSGFGRDLTEQLPETMATAVEGGCDLKGCSSVQWRRGSAASRRSSSSCPTDGRVRGGPAVVSRKGKDEGSVY